MALSKHFLSNRISDLNISRSRFIIGIILGIFAALIFYLLCNVTRDVFRFMSLNEESDVWSLSDKEIFFYNLIYGYISAIFGQTTMLGFLLHQPKVVFERKRFRILDIRNSNHFITWNTIHWLARITTTYGLFYYMFFYSFSLYPDHNFFFILLIIVLFFGSWNSAILFFKRQAIKILLISALSLTALALGLSQINIMNYLPIEAQLLQLNIYYNYEYEKVQTEVFEYIGRPDQVENIYFVYPKDKNKKAPVILYHNQEIGVDQIKSVIDSSRNSRDEADTRFLIFQLCVHKDVPMDIVNKVKIELAKKDAFKIAYSAIPKNAEYEQRYYRNVGLPYKTLPIKWLNRGSQLPFSPYDFIKKPGFFDNDLIIHQLNEEYCQVNDSIINYKDLISYMKPIIASKKRHVFFLVINKDLSFESYFKVISSHRRARYQALNDLSISIHGIPYDQLNCELAREIDKEIRSPYIEIYPELNEHLIEEGFLSQEDFDKYLHSK